MRKGTAMTLIALGVALLLASLSSVAWRQSRALEELADLDGLRRQISLERSEQSELETRVQYLESRGRVVPEARAVLGMKTPSASDIVILAGDRP